MHGCPPCPLIIQPTGGVKRGRLNIYACPGVKRGTYVVVVVAMRRLVATREALAKLVASAFFGWVSGLI
jgi:hypothetical protein